MIIGIIKAREPRIRVTVTGRRGRTQEIDAVVDSGYTGWLTLPSDVIEELELPWRTFARATLADGSVSYFDVYQAKIFWDGRLRSVIVDEFNATPLVGMALMQGFELRMQIKGRGKLTIKRLPTSRH